MSASRYHTGRRSLDLGRGPYLIGILNVTPDSFSDGGDHLTMAAARQRALEMVAEGAVVVDIGGESTRPGHRPVNAQTEIARVVPVIESLPDERDFLVSVDTSKAVVAEQALRAGADIVNDVWGFQRDPEIAAVTAAHGAACILMHNRPTDEAGQGDLIGAIIEFWKRAVDGALEAGVREDAIALDPGIGFGKTFDENWQVMARLDELADFGFPLLLGASRKSFLGKLLALDAPRDRVAATLATTARAIHAGVSMIRVHDVRENDHVVQVLRRCRG